MAQLYARMPRSRRSGGAGVERLITHLVELVRHLQEVQRTPLHLLHLLLPPRGSAAEADAAEGLALQVAEGIAAQVDLPLPLTLTLTLNLTLTLTLTLTPAPTLSTSRCRWTGS